MTRTKKNKTPLPLHRSQKLIQQIMFAANRLTCVYILGICNRHMLSVWRFQRWQNSWQLVLCQIASNCRKQMKRTFHVTTAFNKTGQAVVQYFCGQTDELPLSCDSFKVMRDDNSILARRCNDWGDDGAQAQTQIGTWGHYLTATDPDDGRLYSFAAFIGNTSYWHLSPIERLLLCDDNRLELPGLYAGDFWKIYAR